MKEALTSYEKLLKFVELDSMSLYSKLRLQCALVRVGILYLIPYLPALSLDGQRVAPPLKTPIRTHGPRTVLERSMCQPVHLAGYLRTGHRSNRGNRPHPDNFSGATGKKCCDIRHAADHVYLETPNG